MDSWVLEECDVVGSGSGMGPSFTLASCCIIIVTARTSDNSVLAGPTPDLH